MTISVIGQVCSSAGLVQEVDRAGDPIPWVMPANSYLRSQPARIPLYFDHDHSWEIGSVGHLERSRRGLMAVGRITADVGDLLSDGDWWLSDQVWCRAVGPLEKGHATMTELSLVRRTANLATRPVCWSRGDIATGSAGEPQMPLFWRDTWHRAAERMSAQRYRVAPKHLEIHDLDPLGIVDELLTDPVAARKLARSAPVPKVKATTRPQPKPAPFVPPSSLTDWDLVDAGVLKIDGLSPAS